MGDKVMSLLGKKTALNILKNLETEALELTELFEIHKELAGEEVDYFYSCQLMPKVDVVIRNAKQYTHFFTKDEVDMLVLRVWKLDAWTVNMSQALKAVTDSYTWHVIFDHRSGDLFKRLQDTFTVSDGSGVNPEE
jgi:hypothetical protein